MSDSAERESLYLGEDALKARDSAARDEILALFPDVAGGVDVEPARRFVKSRPARVLVARHAAQRHALVACPGIC